MGSPKYSTTEGKGTITFAVDPISLRAYLRELNGLDKDVQDAVRDTSHTWASEMAMDMKREAYMAPTPQARLVAETIEAKRDRLPTVKVGGPKKVGRAYGGKKGRSKSGRATRASAGQLLYGAEYGSQRGVDRIGRKYTNRFAAPHNPRGYFINPVAEAWGPELYERWLDYVGKIIRQRGLD